jgi:hypothetical protein
MRADTVIRVGDPRWVAYFREHPRVLQVYRGIIWSLAAIRGDLGVQPEATTSAEVLEDPRKLRAVARAIYDELVGLEESWRNISGPERKMTPVKQRFPGGYNEVEPHVLATCRRWPHEPPWGATFTQLAHELGSLGSAAPHT